MIKGFRDFIMRGNIVELAIAVVIGTAFAKVIDVFVSSIVTPILNALPGANANGFGFSIRGGVLKGKTFIDISSVINAVIVFVLTAAVVYFIFVVPMMKVAERRARGVEPEAEVVPEDIALLREIRDALASKST
jgi:large conductance mechanosensitive channel